MRNYKSTKSDDIFLFSFVEFRIFNTLLDLSNTFPPNTNVTNNVAWNRIAYMLKDNEKDF